MKEAFVHNQEALLTREYLDARLKKFEARFDRHFRRIFVFQWVSVALVSYPNLKACLGL